MSTAVATKVHSSLGASVADRWMKCPGSVRMSEGIPGRDSEHARSGTAAHAVAELCLRHARNAASYVGTSVEGVEVDEEMAEAVQVFVDHCWTLLRDVSQFGVETRVSLAVLNPPAPMFGTADFWAYNADTDTLHVVDYKNGSGVVVEVVGNVQLRYYALGVALQLDKNIGIDQVVITIVQPNAPHPDGVVRSEHLSYVDLLAFAAELMEGARATLDPAAPLHAGSHCRFCPASAVCPAQREQAQAIAMVEFDQLPTLAPPAPSVLPVEVLADILPKLDLLDKWIKSCRAHAQDLLERGFDVPGQKLVAKRPTRHWVNEKEAADYLTERGYNDAEIFRDAPLKSPAMIETLIGKKNLPGDLVVKKSSGYTMASTSDKRPEVHLDSGGEFEVLA